MQTNNVLFLNFLEGENQSGMSLIELMIVLSIIGILAMVAFPSYQQYILNARRADCATQLLRLKLQQESYRLTHLSYASTEQLALLQSDYYDFTVVNESATTFRLVALAKGSQQQDGPCQTLSLDQSMNKLPSACW